MGGTRDKMRDDYRKALLVANGNLNFFGGAPTIGGATVEAIVSKGMRAGVPEETMRPVAEFCFMAKEAGFGRVMFDITNLLAEGNLSLT